jgi:hypothetical protein
MIRNLNKIYNNRTILLTKRFINTNNYNYNEKALPFKIDRNSAITKFEANKNFLESTFTNHNNHITFDNDPIKETFVPFYGANVKNVYAVYSGEYGHDRTEIYVYYMYNAATKTMTPYIGTRTVTDWYKCSGETNTTDYLFGKKELQFYAGFKYPIENINMVLQMDDVIKIEEITTSMLTAYNGMSRQMDQHEMSEKNITNKITNKIIEYEQIRAEKNIIKKYKSDHARINKIKLYYINDNFELIKYYLPLYVYSYNTENNTYYKFLNAYNGNYTGQFIPSFTKTTLFGISLGTVGSVINILMLVNPLMTTYSFVMRFMIGSTIGGITSAAFAKLYPKYRNWRYSIEIENERKNNEKTLISISCNDNCKSIPIDVYENLKKLGLDTIDLSILDEVKINEAFVNKLKEYEKLNNTLFCDHIKKDLEHAKNIVIKYLEQ